ncbi:Diaminopimelate epimerase [Geodia barretti]|uniref:diaminopimelate epimerase n=1 Tax=Geodia barretti TaxID=519541 RepID=A0AA35TKG4_GEOBA|nr:Diaminopimelate epimerase [Geodia barretti]
MEFTKMHGAGNDYVYVDARAMPEHDWGQLSQAISDRHFGVGSDGLILVMDSDVADLKMRMFNVDGSEGEMCGNGIRCFAKYAIERGIVPRSVGEVTIDTMAGVRTVVPRYDGSEINAARVSMGKPRFAPSDIPIHPGDFRLFLTFVSMGNPHAVTFIDQPVEEFPLHNIGPLVERHPIFPKRVNFEVVNIRDDGNLDARVWERGSGETMACGTGACAIGVASRLLGHTGDRVAVHLPGGTLTIDWDGTDEVYLEGPAGRGF